MNDGVKANDAGQRCFFELEVEHIAALELDVGMKATSLLDHLRRKIDAAHGHAAILQIAGDVSGPASELADHSLSANAVGEAIENGPVEGFAGQLLGEFL